MFIYVDNGNRSEIRIFSGNISILINFVAKFKINLTWKERVPLGARLYRLYSSPGSSPLSRWRAGGYSESLVIVGREMIDNQSKKKKYSQ